MSDSVAAGVIAAVAAAQRIDPARVRLDSTFEELGVDSLSALSLVADLENEFDVNVPDRKVLLMRTIRDAVTAIEEARGAAGASSPSRSGEDDGEA